MTTAIHFFEDFSAARGEVTTVDGKTMPMFRLILSVRKQDAAGHHPPQPLPDVWMEPSTAVALVQALQTALKSHFPLEYSRLADGGAGAEGGPPHLQ